MRSMCQVGRVGKRHVDKAWQEGTNALRIQNPAHKQPQSQASSNGLASPLGRKTLRAHQLLDLEVPSQSLFPSPSCLICAGQTTGPPSGLQTHPRLTTQPMHRPHRLPPHSLQEANRAAPTPPPTLWFPSHKLHGHMVMLGRGLPTPVSTPRQVTVASVFHPRLPAQLGQIMEENIRPGLSLNLMSQLPPPHWPANTEVSSPPQGTPCAHLSLIRRHRPPPRFPSRVLRRVGFQSSCWVTMAKRKGSRKR